MVAKMKKNILLFGVINRARNALKWLLNYQSNMRVFLSFWGKRPYKEGGI